jgi:hypothetical protein
MKNAEATKESKMNAVQMVDERMAKAIRQSLTEARAKGQKARIRRLTALLAEVEAAR